MERLQITDDAMKSAVVKAVIDSMEPHLMQEMVASAVKDFITKPDKTSGRSYTDRQTPLEEAFQYAVTQLARDAVRDQLAENGQLMEKIKAAIQEAIVKAFEGEKRDEMIDHMADAVGAAFKVSRY